MWVVPPGGSLGLVALTCQVLGPVLPEVAARPALDPLEPRWLCASASRLICPLTPRSGYSRYRHAVRAPLPPNKLVWGDDPTHDPPGARVAGSDGPGGHDLAARSTAVERLWNADDDA